MVRVVAGGRLHFGFQNLSLAHRRLYGSLGVALEEPRVVVEAEPLDAQASSTDSLASDGGVRPDDVAARAASADRATVGAGGPGGTGEVGVVSCDDPVAREYARRAVELLDVPGARVSVERKLPRHVGLGSGTQLALAVLAAVAAAHDHEPRVRERAPDLGRGGRSGVGVATFESGGFVLDAGHPTGRFTADRPARGEWTVPPVVAHHDVPDDWRFVVVLPAAEPGRSGDGEDATMRSVVERADPAVADEISAVVTRRVLPAVARGDAAAFGAGVAEVGRLNGAWYADEQGGVYRPPVGAIVASLDDCTAIHGAGQSSWGPAVYGVTTGERAGEAREGAAAALDAAGVDGEVLVTAVRNRGARIGTGQ